MEKQVKYFLSSSVKNEIIEISVKGELTKDTFENLTKEMNAAIKSAGKRKAIADIRAVDKRLDNADLYRYLRIHDIVLFDIQYAIVDLAQNAGFRNAAIEAGIESTVWFTDMDTARQWIKGTRKTEPVSFPDAPTVA